MSNGDMARRHVRIVSDSINKTMPIDMFASLSRTVLQLMGHGGRIRWDDYANRYTLDAFGIGVVGYNFESLTKPDGAFVRRYHEVMHAIADPVNVALPILERWAPRRRVQKMVDSFVSDLCTILDEKKHNPGNDVITYMFEEPEMTELEYRDNTIVMFVAGHVSCLPFSLDVFVTSMLGHYRWCNFFDRILLGSIPRNSGSRTSRGHRRSRPRRTSSRSFRPYPPPQRSLARIYAHQHSFKHHSPSNVRYSRPYRAVHDSPGYPYGFQHLRCTSQSFFVAMSKRVRPRTLLARRQDGRRGY